MRWPGKPRKPEASRFCGVMPPRRDKAQARQYSLKLCRNGHLIFGFFVFKYSNLEKQVEQN